MDWISITSGCFAASKTIASTSQAIHGFVREVRESRADLDVVSGELHSLDGVLDLLKDDAGAFPKDLAHIIPGILEQCTAILSELEGCLRVVNGPGPGISRLDKKFRWLASRTQISRLRFTLEAYKSAFGLALDLIAITSPRSANSSDTDLPAQIDHREADRDREISRVLLEMGYLKARLVEDFQENGMASGLQGYIDALQVHAEDAGLSPLREDFPVVPRATSVDNTSAPDSAIELNDEPDFTSPKGVAESPTDSPVPRLEEVDEFLDELKEMPSRPPTPPPKAARRLSMISRSSSVVYPSGRTPSVAESSNTAHSDPLSNRISSSLPSPSSSYMPLSPMPYVTALNPRPPSMRPRRRSSISGFAPSHPTAGNSIYTFVTEISAGSAESDSTHSELPSRSSSRVGRFLGHVRSLSSDKAKEATIPEERPSSVMSFHSPVELVRRSSKCITANINKLGSVGAHTIEAAAGSLLHPHHHYSWRPPLGRTTPKPESITAPAPTPPRTPPLPSPAALATPAGPNPIFGVSLKNSMAVAKACATTHHAGSKGNSRRDFPVCILKCVSFLRQDGNAGLSSPHIFAEGGDPELVRGLQRAFSTGPTYGRDMDCAAYGGVYEAADVIVHFLAQLPKPLVPESVAKRWIALSKQATLPGAHAVRLEQCIDFWEEALGGMRGPGRSLFKLLLNLWGDVADLAEENQMTAERLASRVVQPLMHLPVNKYDTDYMLGLAFMIRKRSEYSMILRGEGRKSNAAF